MSLWIFAVLSVLAPLGASSASTQLITNDKPSDVVKAKSFKSYHEVLLIPPKGDPRHVVPRVASEIEPFGAFQERGRGMTARVTSSRDYP
jgi:hypothetical protein